MSENGILAAMCERHNLFYSADNEEICPKCVEEGAVLVKCIECQSTDVFKINKDKKDTKLGCTDCGARFEFKSD
ncbi:hypothetical protein LCGC14_0196150 [marine sediment metagenome]|uniref:Uncharacterized protein n=1 Tax=marine sediment metagenome TaxID=412755 RepID=A0A0F9V271_9ZZZZ